MCVKNAQILLYDENLIEKMMVFAEQFPVYLGAQTGIVSETNKAEQGSR